MANPRVKAPRTIVLDVAGTLIELDRPVGDVYAGFVADAGGTPDASRTIERRFAEALRSAPPLTFGRPDPAAERAWWRAVARATVGDGDRGLDFDRFFDHAYEWFATAEAWRVPGDVRPALRMLRRAEHPLAVLSNWDGRLVALLRALGLEGYFAAILVSSELSAAKPSRAIFDAARERLRALSGEVVPIMVGDRIANDVTPALAAGWDAVWLDRGQQGAAPPDGVVKITSLGALAERL